MLSSSRLESARDILRQLAQAQTVSALCLSQLEELVATDEEIEIPSGRTLPLADESRFCVVWDQRICSLGHTTSFRLFARLLRRANHYVSYDHLLRDVWSNARKSPDTIRSAVRELKAKLIRAKMRRLATAIRGQGRHYGLMLGD